MTLQELQTKKIAILGLGINNKNLAEYFKSRKIPYEVFDDWQSPAELTGKIDGFDVVFRTPGLPFLSRPIQQARQNGAVVYSQTKLFFDLCPGQIIGVTGTKGKGTAATLTRNILAAAGKRAFLAGNIGQDPFAFLDQIAPADLVVLELSSFQLQDLHKSPHVAVVLKITPEHLDYHHDLEEYIDAKTPILAYQSAADFAVLNYDQEITRSFAPKTAGQIVWNSLSQAVKPGCFVNNEKIILNFDQTVELLDVAAIQLLGRFNLENVTAAIAAAAVAGVKDYAAMRKAVAQFRALPHRLELVAEVKGVKFYNDSFATTPETTMAALSAFLEPVILIVGGSEKKADYRELGKAIAHSKIKALLPIGVTGPAIAKLARGAGYRGRIADQIFTAMPQIVKAANDLAQRGDAVLLSPASASFGMFKNYKHRGELFKKFAVRLEKI